jgi:hypothetical protein
LPVDVLVARLKQSLPRHAARLVIRALAGRALEGPGSFREVAPGRLQYGTVHLASEKEFRKSPVPLLNRSEPQCRTIRTHAAGSLTISWANRLKPRGLRLSDDCLKRLSTNRVEKRRRFHGGNFEIPIVEFGKVC